MEKEWVDGAEVGWWLRVELSKATWWVEWTLVTVSDISKANKHARARLYRASVPKWKVLEEAVTAR